MSSNLLEENDLDPEGSVSSFNSENEKVDSSLIKRILSEMKSEFNRGTSANSDDGNENEDSSDGLTPSNTEQPCELEVKVGEGSVKQEDVDEFENNLKVEHDQEEEGEECINEPIVINKSIFDAEEQRDDQKPRLILTLRTSEEDRELAGRLGRKSTSNQSSTENINSSIENDTSVTEKSDADDKGSAWECRSRRSLRSSSRITDRESENAGMTRSSRRFSKEQCRESVLQSAIARKEKSFSSFNQTEERSNRRARSPRQSPSEAKTHRPVTRNVGILDKGFKQSSSVEGSVSDVNQKLDDLSDTNTLLSIKTEPDLNFTTRKFENDEMSNDSNDTINMNSASTNSQTSEAPSEYNLLKLNKIYTKTGKRRIKHFKGLKYSLTGGKVRKRVDLARKRKNNLGKNILTNKSFECTQIKSENIDNESTENGAIDEDGFINPFSSECEKDASSFKVKEEVTTDSPTEVLQSTANKRKYESEADESDSQKRCREDIPSPLQGDAEAEPDKPEATSVPIGIGSAGLCLCNRRLDIYAKTTGSEAVLYCQAVDSLDGRLIGCCNTVERADARLLRPSPRVPFLVLCAVHNDRLQRHNCCPGCGIFCTQGQFMQCSAYHQYHRDCQLEQTGKHLCPHCGADDNCDVNISLGAHKYPVFLPMQMPPKKTPSAKITLSYGYEPSDQRDTNSPLVPPQALVLPSGVQISSQGVPTPLDKDKLEQLLHVACSVQPLSSPRFTLRNMYQSAKNGEAEKIVQMIAIGLNVNHVFREWGLGSALHAAANGGHLAVVHLLVQAGASTDVLDREQNTPLMLACANKHNQVVKYLVKAGASVTLKGGDGMTALHLAAKSGNVEACYYLISNPNTPRSFIDTVDDGRWTPLVWAAEHKHYDVVKFLLEKRADPLVRDAEQNIALHWAALSGSVDISEALLNYGSDVNSTNAHADTPLHIAARQNAYDCVTLLLARGARVDMHNRAGCVPLDCVVGETDTYTAIKLNVELRNLSLTVYKRAHKILTNDITRGHEANPIQCVNSKDEEQEPQDFVYVTENCFTSNISIDRTITSLQSCKCRDVCISGGCMCGKISIRCWYDDEGKLLPEFNFADPPMLFECNQACACNKLTCKNRVVQHGITARFQLFRAKGNKGWGVRTLRIIPKGTYVCEYIGEIISDCEADTREDDSYLFDLDNRDGETYCIDARRYGNIARFINHSCTPNLLPVRVFIDHQDLHFPRIAFFANRDIQAHEELGFDYGEKFWIIKWKLFTCTCGAESCKYSESTIEKTLAAYNKKLQQEERH